MSLEDRIYVVIMAGLFVVTLLFLLFAQVTVRKLERNPATRDHFGMEFVSGWRILKIAEALAMPMAFFRIVRNSAASFLFADAELIRKHTGRFDRILGFLFFWLFNVMTFGLITLVLAKGLGAFD